MNAGDQSRRNFAYVTNNSKTQKIELNNSCIIYIILLLI